MQTEYVKSTAIGGSGTSASPANITPAAGDDLILLLLTYTAGAAIASVTSSVGAGVIADIPLAIAPNSDNVGFGVYRVHGASALAQAISVNFEGTTEYRAWLIEASSVSAFDPNMVAVLIGAGTTIGTNSLTPSQEGALLLAFGGSNHYVASQAGWSDGFSNLTPDIGGPTGLAGYLDQPTVAAAAPTNTIGTSVNPWAALIVSYIPSDAAAAPLAGAASDTTSASGTLSSLTALTGTALETAFEDWVQAQNELPGPIQVPPLPTPEQLYVINHPEVYAHGAPPRGFSTPWQSLIGATPGGYVNLLSIFPFSAPTNGDPLIFYDCVAEALATTENQVLSLDASQITAGAPISLITPSNPSGQKFVNGITASCPAGMAYAVGYYINYP